MLPPIDRAGPQPVHLRIDEEWLSRRQESALEPDIPIIDPHHHLWDRPHPRYLFDDFLSDISSGHNVRATVFVECKSMYRADGAKEERSIGETEFANGIAAMSASGEYGATRICAGIVAAVDLRLGSKVKPLLEAHHAVAPTRLRGIRQISAWNESSAVRVAGPPPPPGLLSDPDFRAGFAHIASLDLSFDAWLFHPQLSELAELAGAFPDTRIALNHVGGPIGIGPYRREDVLKDWREGIRHLAQHPNVHVKLGGLGMKLGGFNFHVLDMPPSSLELAAAWRPYIETCIGEFGPRRCMFESNFPVDKGSCSYAVLWNAFKRLASSFSSSEKAALFAGTAAAFYRLPINSSGLLT